jgi:cell wall-associated NlpC family hydrolase
LTASIPEHRSRSARLPSFGDREALQGRPVAPLTSRSQVSLSPDRRLPTLVAFAPTSSSRDIAAALARRKALQEGRRRAITPEMLQETPTPQTAVDNEDMIREALAYRGTRYVWGGASRGGFDCSGFALYIYRRTRGINLPHRAAEQFKHGVPVARSDLRPGDLVFFRTSRGIGHVAIYIGENKIIHAANRRSNVRIDTLTGWYSQRYAGARRFSPAPELQEDRPPPGTTAVGRENSGTLYLAPPSEK